MPIYEYYCKKCEKEFELKRLMADIDKPAPCPTCGKSGSKLVTAFASIVGLRLRTPAKTSLRKPAMKKTAKSAKSKQHKKRKK